MNILRPVNVLEECILLNWSSLLIGWNNNWLTKQDIINYAVKWLQNNPMETNEAIILLSGAEQYDDDEIRRLLLGIIEKKQLIDEATEIDKWRLAHLIILSQENIDPEKKIVRLEELYAEFGYPADMRLCSRYGPSQKAIKNGLASSSELSIDPVDEMERVIMRLKKRFGVKITEERSRVDTREKLK